jgi:hypothetical protein
MSKRRTILPMKRKSIWLTESQNELLEEVSRVTGEKQSVIIRHALDEYLARYGERDKQNGSSNNE